MADFSERQVVLVDSQDKDLGLMEIYRAHANPGVLHRAISILLFNKKGELLLQQRSEHKPLWPLYWSNTVCTHPFEKESYLDCAVRRLKDEMGISIEKKVLKVLYRFEYQANYNQQLSEHELDTVILGTYNGEVMPNELEVLDYKWVSIQELRQSLEKYPESYTPWFKLILKDPRFESEIE